LSVARRADRGRNCSSPAAEPLATENEPKAQGGNEGGDGFVAVRKVDEPHTRKGKQTPSQDGQRRRGRPPKRRALDAIKIEALQDLAAGES